MNIIKWILRLFGEKRVIEVIQPEPLPVQEVILTPIVEQPEPPKKCRDKSYPPRSMTEREKELYAIKPNLQYWVNKGVL